MHAILASVLQVPELKLEEEECSKLGSALQNVLSQYDVVVSPKAQAWIGAAMVAGAVYGPHIAAYGLRKGADRMEAKAGKTPTARVAARAGLPPQRGEVNGGTAPSGPALDETDGLIFASPFIPGGGLN